MAKIKSRVNKQFKPLILCHCIYSLSLITGASEFLSNKTEWHAFSLQRYSFLYSLYVINLFQPNAWQATKIVHTETWSPEANYSETYGVILNYLGIRAVLVDLAPDYSPDKFLMVLRNFDSLRGYAGKLISDNSTQLKAAKEELRKVAQSLDWDEPTAAGAKMVMEWAFFQPMHLSEKRPLRL